MDSELVAVEATSPFSVETTSALPNYVFEVACSSFFCRSAATRRDQRCC